MRKQVEKTVNSPVQEPDFIDLEWLELCLQAKKMGLSVDEVREFFLENKVCDN